jgi:hypothetical protein
MSERWTSIIMELALNLRWQFSETPFKKQLGKLGNRKLGSWNPKFEFPTP